MAALSNPVPEVAPSLQHVVVLEAAAGASRHRWIEDHLQVAAKSGARIFSLSCHFDSGGPWAGVSSLFWELFPEIQSQRPDLVQRHSLELVYALPQLRRSLTVSNPTLTDQASTHEKVRSYPADRAFRTVHGLIELLEHWKNTNSPHRPWVIACDSYDQAGAMSSCFFRELMRRRGRSLHVRLLVAVDPGKGEKISGLFSSGQT
jgi:hypothetical protein